MLETEYQKIDNNHKILRKKKKKKSCLKTEVRGSHNYIRKKMLTWLDGRSFEIKRVVDWEETSSQNYLQTSCSYWSDNPNHPCKQKGMTGDIQKAQIDLRSSWRNTWQSWPGGGRSGCCQGSGHRQYRRHCMQWTYRKSTSQPGSPYQNISREYIRPEAATVTTWDRKRPDIVWDRSTVQVVCTRSIN